MIKDKNIDPSANFPTQWVDLHNCGSVTNTNGTTVVDAWVAPWAGKVVSASVYVGAATATTYTVDVCNGVATNSASIFTAAITCTSTQNFKVDASSSISSGTFAAGDVLTLRNSGTMSKPTVQIGVRPLLAKEISGY